MDCNEFKNKAFEQPVNALLPSDLQQHIAECEDCANAYHQGRMVTTTLKPRIEVKAPNGLKKSIINHYQKQILMKRKINRRIASIAAIFLVLLIAIPTINSNSQDSAKTAELIFNSSVEAFKTVDNVLIQVKIRTLENDNFELIGKEYNFVNHTISKDFTRLGRWKIEKTGRAVSFDGTNQFLYIKKTGIAYKGNKDQRFTSWLNKLLNPKKLLEEEILNIQKCDDCKYEIDKTGKDIVLTIESKAKGNFENTHAKNSSIEESDSKITYTFSKEDNKLKDVEVRIKDGNKMVLVLDIISITYNTTLTDNMLQIKLPEGLAWKDANAKVVNPTFTDISSKEACTRFFTACSNEKWDEIESVFSNLQSQDPETVKKVKDYLGGLKVVSIGESFTSGLYPGEYVPYKIKLKSGETIKMNLAVRNDNEENVWIIDGGI